MADFSIPTFLHFVFSDTLFTLCCGYNELLYRRMTESALDDCPGMSPRRKALLLKSFGSIERLWRAETAEISAIPGFSEKFAASLLDFLKSR